MRARVTALLSGLAAVFAVVAAMHSNSARAEVAALNASGAVQVANSQNGSAILSGALGPGNSLTGTVTISNIGTASGPFTLGLSHLTDTPGPNGGFFSHELQLAVDDVTSPAAPVAVYHGPVNALNPTSLGNFGPGAVHIYRFAVSWPAGSADQSMYGSSMSVQFDWTATDNSQPASPIPPPTAKPGTPSTGGSASGGAPRLTLKTPSKQKVVKSGGARLTATCITDCTVAATGTFSLGGAAKSYRLMPVRRGTTAGKKLALKLRLPKHAKAPLHAALRKHRKVVVKLGVLATGTTGQSTHVTRKIRVTG
jgi:spore coat-associated protein N